jgi:hypothetical protein
VPSAVVASDGVAGERVVVAVRYERPAGGGAMPLSASRSKALPVMVAPDAPQMESPRSTTASRQSVSMAAFEALRTAAVSSVRPSPPSPWSRTLTTESA